MQVGEKISNPMTLYGCNNICSVWLVQESQPLYKTYASSLLLIVACIHQLWWSLVECHLVCLCCWAITTYTQFGFTGKSTSWMACKA